MHYSAITKHQSGYAYGIAKVFAFRNQPDEAFEWLDRAYIERNSGLIETKVSPLLKGLHKDPRFAVIEETQSAELRLGID